MSTDTDKELDDAFSFDDFDMDSTEALEQADLDLGIQGGTTKQDDLDTFGGLLDPDHPPKLRQEHYEMLKGVDFTGKRKRDKKKNQAQLDKWNKTVDNVRKLTVKQFGFDPDELMGVKSFRRQTEPNKPSVFAEHQQPINPLVEMQKEVAFEKEKLPREDPVYGFDTRIMKEMWTDPSALSTLDRQIPLNFSFKKKGICIFKDLPDPSRDQIKEIRYTNTQLLSRFINERGQIKSRKLTFVSAKYQRKLARAIKQAREIGLMAYDSNFHVPISFQNIAEATTANASAPFDPDKYHSTPKVAANREGELLEELDSLHVPGDNAIELDDEFQRDLEKGLFQEEDNATPAEPKDRKSVV